MSINWQSRQKNRTTLHHKTKLNASHIIISHNFEPQAVMQRHLSGSFYLEQKLHSYSLQLPNTYRVSVLCQILFFLQRKIGPSRLRRILTQTPMVWGARELEDLGTSLWGRAKLLELRRDHYLVTWYAQKKPKKDFRIGYLPHSRIWGSDKHKCSIHQYLLQSLFWSLDQKRWRRNLKVQRSNAVLVILKYVLISENELVLSEMEGNVFLPPSFFRGLFVTRQWD